MPGAPVVENLHRYLVFDATTSLGWDTGRAITNALLIALAGRAVLGALRRAARRASFDAPVDFVPRTRRKHSNRREFARQAGMATGRLRRSSTGRSRSTKLSQ